jgi:hypothetical protein
MYKPIAVTVVYSCDNIYLTVCLQGFGQKVVMVTYDVNVQNKTTVNGLPRLGVSEVFSICLLVVTNRSKC